jgi:hypothetical protein
VPRRWARIRPDRMPPRPRATVFVGPVAKMVAHFPTPSLPHFPESGQCATMRTLTPAVEDQEEG